MLSHPVWLLALARSVGAASLSSLSRDVERLESVREIKDVQKSFAQYAQFGRWREMAELFAEDGTIHWGQGAPLDDDDADIIQGPDDIEVWLADDAGDMDGIRPGSFNAHLTEMPVVSLSEDGSTAKARWQVLRLMGDGAGETRVQAGVYENEYVRIDGGEDDEGRWRISLLHYYPMTEGNFNEGWDNVGSGERLLPIIPYHFTPDEAGITIPISEASAESGDDDENSDNENDSDKSDDIDDIDDIDGIADIDVLAYKISQLNDEDHVRNLQHAYGYYVDQRMWTDVLDLCTEDATLVIDGTTHSGLDEIRSALEEWMGPEDLAEGILNEHPMFNVIVEVSADGFDATARGLEMGLIGDMGEPQGWWWFNVFRNAFVKDEKTGIWKIKTLDFTRLIDAEYKDGWGGSEDVPSEDTIDPPEFISGTWRYQSSPEDYNTPTHSFDSADALLNHLTDRLSQSAAFDETENVGSAYGNFADDIRCQNFADLHAENGFKESPGVGWYVTRERIAEACLARYNTYDPDPQRERVPFHWRIQPVIIPSNDGRSTSMRTRLLQFGTSNEDKSGFDGLQGFNGGMYHDQFILEEASDGTLRRKLWCLTIDEFYWQTPEWEEGWIAPRSEKRGLTPRQDLAEDYPPDVPLTDPNLGDREMGLPGGPIDSIAYPQILTMWFAYRNPVSGRLPDAYWAPGCVPCRGAMPEWALPENGYQEPPTGPTLLKATVEDSDIVVEVTAGPEEEVSGVVELRVERGDDEELSLLGSETLDEDGRATLELSPESRDHEDRDLVVVYLGNDNIKPGRVKVISE